jgi:hypothetical protein
MSIVPQIFNGMHGKRSINVVGNMPEFGYANDGLLKPVIRLNYKRTNFLADNNCMRQSVLRTNQSGTYGVKPCKGAPAVGFAGGAERVLRRPAIPFEGGLYPQQGFARHQRKGLAFLKEKPLNLPLLPIADSFNAGLNSKLGQPA